MSSSERQWQWQRPRRFSFVCSFASQLDPIEPQSSSVRLSKDVEIGNRTVSMPVIKYVLLKLIHSCRRWIDPLGAAMIPIHLLLFQQNGTRLSVHSPIKLCELNLVSERWFMVPKLLLLSETRNRGGGVCTDIIEGYLSSMNIPEKMHPSIIQDIYDEAQVADPALPIDVTMVNVTVWVLGKPPTKSSSASSSIAGLENVRLDCLESCIRQEPCAICEESLDHIYDAQEGFTRLPCLHIFHRDCLVQRLEIRQECPVCKYPLPNIVPEGEPSGQLHWPVLLIMSACGILTATRLCRLLKPT
ncbi:hypothetical protein M0R45_018002 [Rubus argutus]|uniref:RING-type E3 ubiquitin transferase n=1 Tax=Rubus argutus TaxID=59490 RepID=A0AAW1XZU5_RUBAR